MTTHTPSGQQAVEPVLSAAETADRLEAWAREMLASTPPKTGALHLLDAVHYLRTAAPTAPSTADTVAVPRSMLAPFVAEAENWADSVPDDYRPLCTEPGKKHAYPGSDTSYSVGDVRRLAAHCAAAPSTPYPLAVTTEMLEAAKEGFHDADENNCDLDDCWGAALTAALGAAPSTAAGEPALVCGCGWEGSYADLNETAEGMTCPKCRLSRNMDCAATPPAQGVEEENETLENLIDAAIGARTAPPWEEQAAQIRRQALEEAAKVCDQRAKTAVSHMGATDVPSHKEAFARDAEEAEDCADDIRALLSKPAKGEG